MIEEDYSESPRKKFSSVVLLAAGGVLVATVFATLASMLATGSKPEAGPPENKAEVEQTVSTSTSVSIAPDGSTSTVVITVSSTVKSKPDQVKPAGEEDKPEVVVTPTEQTTAEPTTTSPQSNPPSSWSPSQPPASSSSSSTTPTSTTPTNPPKP